ncbi:mechanosensitive ion channel family protein [Thermodesulfobacteriota bacterium]
MHDKYSLLKKAALLFPCVFLICVFAADMPAADNATGAASARTGQSIAHLADQVWNFELWSIDNHTVSVKTAASSLMIIILGFLAAKYACWLLGKRLLSAKRINENTASIIQKVVYYFLLVFVLLFSLRVLNIPLTAFTFLGGALAIGVGFGTQTIMSNFISGFIIMAERPIRVGDLIQLESNFATVEAVGVRCTRIRTADNVHILVPNSKFLDQSIINWTLSDKRVRVTVTVGVVYGSPVREAELLLLQAAGEHPDVKQDPAPYVRFSDFGDNALIFDLYFWISMINLTERKRIASDLRFRIDELFRAANIIIAFPQRDVHLDTLKPLEVRITKD